MGVLSGELAFYEMLRWQRGLSSCARAVHETPTIEMDEMPAHEEGLRRLDEERKEGRAT